MILKNSDLPVFGESLVAERLWIGFWQKRHRRTKPSPFMYIHSWTSVIWIFFISNSIWFPFHFQLGMTYTKLKIHWRLCNKSLKNLNSLKVRVCIRLYVGYARGCDQLVIYLHTLYNHVLVDQCLAYLYQLIHSDF